MSKPFEAYIFRPNNLDYVPGVTINLPSAPFALLDALEKAGIANERDIYHVEVTDGWPDCLPRFIPESANLYELNHLAQRLSAMSERELNCFEGMVMMDSIKTEYAPISVERLINMTHSTDDCQIIYEAHNDKSLGRFYVENDFPVIPENIPEALYELLDYEAIGRKERMAEGGVFTEKGYVVHGGEMAQVYKSGDAVPLKKSGSTIMLEVCRGYFNDPAYDGSLSEFPLLPTDDGILDRTAAQVEAASIEECSIRAADCIVPRLTELISDSLYASEGDCYGAVNELALQLQKLERSGQLYTYKAMVEAAPQDITLEEAIDLAGQVGWFSVIKDAASPAAYAKDTLSKYYIELQDELFSCANLDRYGKRLVEENGIALTGYGALRSMDGRTVDQCQNRESPMKGMEMK